MLGPYLAQKTGNSRLRIRPSVRGGRIPPDVRRIGIERQASDQPPISCVARVFTATGRQALTQIPRIRYRSVAITDTLAIRPLRISRECLNYDTTAILAKEGTPSCSDLQSALGCLGRSIPEPLVRPYRDPPSELSRDMAMRRDDRWGLWIGVLVGVARFCQALAGDRRRVPR